MQFDKSQLLDLLRSQGDEGRAQQADQQLPQQVDTEQHAGLLQQLGIDPQEIITRLMGGGGGGGGGGLGGLLGGR